MSEQDNHDTPSPKPKVGSLKDRIAAFEKSAQSDNTLTQKSLPPRSKPGNVSWKPSPPPPKDDGDEKIEKKHSGMSAEDAKESIGAGGGLKARMAALQGNMNPSGGSPATPSPPIPKPLRKPFVPRPRTPDEDEEGENKDKPKELLEIPHRRLDNWDPLAATVAAANARQKSASPPAEAESGGGEPTTAAATEEQTQEQEQDEENKERERRAALAARMARLGGARIGMAPPIVPKKPKPATPVDEESHPAVKTSQQVPVRVLPIPGGEDTVQTPTEVRETGSDTLRNVTGQFIDFLIHLYIF